MIRCHIEAENHRPNHPFTHSTKLTLTLSCSLLLIARCNEHFFCYFVRINLSIKPYLCSANGNRRLPLVVHARNVITNLRALQEV